MTIHKRFGSIRTITTAIIAAAQLGGCLSEENNTTLID